jgi:hypothetical protein
MAADCTAYRAWRGGPARELLAQRHARAVQARLHRGDRLAHDLRGLLVGQLLDVAQQDDRPVVRRQQIDGPADVGVELAGEHLVLSAGRPVGEQEGALPRPVPVVLEARELVFEAHLQLAEHRPHLILARDVGPDGNRAVCPFSG